MDSSHIGMDINTDARLARRRISRAVSQTSEYPPSQFSDFQASAINAGDESRSVMALAIAPLAKQLGKFGKFDSSKSYSNKALPAYRVHTATLSSR